MKIIRNLIYSVLAAFLVAGTATVSNAQRLDGTLKVTVTDSKGGAILDAKVTITNEANGVSNATSASSDGTYVFPNVLVGTYTVSVEKDGFKKYVSKGVQVGANQTTEAKAKLDIGAVTETIQVEAGAELIKTTTSELSNEVQGKIVNQLPIAAPGGSVLELAVGFPNTTTQQGGVLGSGGSIGGTRPRFNGFSIDGVDDNRADVNGPIQPVIQDSVQEFTLLTNQFSAEYGHSAGGQFAITTKSGTNNWHGEGHEYNRNRNYDAFDNLQKQRGLKDRYDYNRAGASIGGPMIKNRLFIFGAYEFQNNGLAASSPSVTLPTAAGLATLNTLAANSAVKAILAQFPTAPTASGTVTVNGTLIPVGTFTSIAPAFSNQWDFNINVDANLGKHQLRTRFLYDRFRAPDFNASQPQLQFLGTNASDARKFILSDAWSVSNSVMNDFRASYSRLFGPTLIVPAAFANFPNVEIDGLGINVGPDGNAPQGYVQNVYQIADNMTWVKGRNTVKFGVEWRHYIAPSIFLPRARGEWDYANLQQFIRDEVPTGGNGALRGAGAATFASNNNAAYWFIQDDIKVTSRLTLNLGLRYEWSGIPRDENLQAGNALADDPALGIFFRAPKPDLNNFAPRFGFAWDPTGSGKWAVRGGAGLAYDVTPNNFATLQLPPQQQFENNPDITCAVAPATAWCPSYLAGGTGAGFLAAGGLSPFIQPHDTASARALTQGLNVDQTAPKVFTWTLGVQHAIMKNTSVEVRYLGTHSVSLPAQIRLNEVSAFDPNFASLGGNLTPLPTFFSASAVPTHITNPASTLQKFDNFNPHPLSLDGFQSVFTIFPASAQSIYHSGSVDVIHRLTHGLYVRGNYTFSKNIDNATNELFSSFVNPRRPQDARNLADERGRSALDINQKLAISWVFDFPNIQTTNAFAKGFLHGWTISGTYLAQSGQPVTALSDADSNANGSSAGDRVILNPNGVGLTGSTVSYVCNAGAGGATSIVVDPSTCGSGNDANIVGYVADTPTARFIQAGTGAKPNVGRNTINTPGLNIWNMSLLKSTKIGERFTVQFRAETYNTFNHPNFSIGLPSNNGALDQVTNPNPLSTTYSFVDSGSLFLNSRAFNGGSRTMQLGLKLIW